MVKKNRSQLAFQKAKMIEQVKDQNDMVQKQKKDLFLKHQQEVDYRLYELEQEKQHKQIYDKKSQQKKDQDRRDVLSKMIQMEEEKKNEFKDKRKMTDYKVAMQ